MKRWSRFYVRRRRRGCNGGEEGSRAAGNGGGGVGTGTEGYGGVGGEGGGAGDERGGQGGTGLEREGGGVGQGEGSGGMSGGVGAGDGGRSMATVERGASLVLGSWRTSIPVSGVEEADDIDEAWDSLFSEGADPSFGEAGSSRAVTEREIIDVNSGSDTKTGGNFLGFGIPKEKET